MNGEGWGLLLLLIGCGLSVWLTVLCVRLCGDVKAIKRILMAVNDLEEFSAITGRAYRRRKRTVPVEENSIRGAEFLE